MQTPRKVPYIGPRSRRLDEISGLRTINPDISSNFV